MITSITGIKIDVSGKAARDRNYEATVEDIEEWICQNGPLPERSIVLFDFGWSYRYDDQRRYFGDDSLLDLLLPAQYSWPGISLGKVIMRTEFFSLKFASSYNVHLNTNINITHILYDKHIFVKQQFNIFDTNYIFINSIVFKTLLSLEKIDKTSFLL